MKASGDIRAPAKRDLNRKLAIPKGWKAIFNRDKNDFQDKIINPKYRNPGQVNTVNNQKSGCALCFFIAGLSGLLKNVVRWLGCRA